MDYSATYLSGQISAAEKIASAVGELDISTSDRDTVRQAIAGLYPTAHIASEGDIVALRYIRRFRGLEPTQARLDDLERQEAEILARYDISTLEDIALAAAEQPVLVFTGDLRSAQDVYDDLLERGVDVTSIEPHHSAAAREQAVADFQEGRARALVTTFAAGGVGWNVSNGARVMFYGEGVIGAGPNGVFQAKGRVRG